MCSRSIDWTLTCCGCCACCACSVCCTCCVCWHWREGIERNTNLVVTPRFDGRLQNKQPANTQENKRPRNKCVLSFLPRYFVCHLECYASLVINEHRWNFDIAAADRNEGHVALAGIVVVHHNNSCSSSILQFDQPERNKWSCTNIFFIGWMNTEWICLIYFIAATNTCAIWTFVTKEQFPRSRSRIFVVGLALLSR